jgi:hypothetical protein
MRTPRLVVSTVACAMALSLAACGHQQTAAFYRVHDDPALRVHVHATAQTTTSDPTVGQLWNSFQTSLASVKSVRITGSVPFETKTATIDVSGMRDNSCSRATITADNQTFEDTVINGTAYVKANSAWWRAAGASNATITAIGSRYVATTDPSMTGLSVGTMLNSFKTNETITDGMGVIAEKTTLNGHPVYLFSVTTKEGRMTIWVTDTAYTLMKVRFEATNGTEELTFSEWNVPVSFTPPPPAEVVKI